MINTYYLSSLMGILGYKGVGGKLIFTFEATKSGIDTIKISTCIDEELKNIKDNIAENQFVVKVK